MTEEIQLERAHFSEGEGTVAPERECPALKPPGGFLHVDCMRIPKRRGTSFFQAGVGTNRETTTVQMAARQEFAKLPMDQKQRGTVSIEQTKQFDLGG